MNERDRLAIEQACARLATAFHTYIDSFEHDAVLGLFAEDAVWIHAIAGPLRGLDEIKAYLDSKSTRPTTLHVTSNILIDVVDESHAKGRVYYTFYYDGEGRRPAPLTGPTVVGLYRDEYVRTPAGWRFSRREPQNLFEAAGFGSVIIRKSDERQMAVAEEIMHEDRDVLRTLGK